MPIVKKANKVTAAKTVTKSGGLVGTRPAAPEVGQRYIQFYYSISVAGSIEGLDIRKFNGTTPIGPVGGPPHIPPYILHEISEDLHAQITFQAPTAK